MARVIGLFISSSYAKRMQACTGVQALAGQGLKGDRYAIGQGTYSKLCVKSLGMCRSSDAKPWRLPTRN